jgi:hypothetical protein
MLQGLAHTICVYAKKASGGGGDNTPNAVNWSNVSQTGVGKNNTYVYSAQQITGIDTSIALQVVFSNTAFAALKYKIQSTSTVPASNSSPLSNSYIAASHNSTITVSNNEYLVFASQGSIGQSTTVTVNNTSDSNATLDTFTAST